MTNPSELANGLRTRAGFLAKADEHDWRDEIDASVSLLSEAADTIDRLTSTGEAVPVAWMNRHTKAIGRIIPADPTDYIPLYASPREGHVEVPVEGLDRDELLGITEYLMMQADIDTPDDTEPDCDDLCGNRVCAAVGCVVRKFRRVRAALPHNQGETKP